MRQLILILMLSVSGWSANYYFANTGSDATGDGSIGNPWATVTKYNNQTTADGDSLLFKRGDIWYGIRAIPKNGGTSNYIYTAAYGDTTKPLPIISAGRLVSGAGFEWHQSAHGTHEYYLTLTGGSNPSVTSRPAYFWINNESLDTATIGSLLDHQYNWGDNDALGFSTIYLRLDAGDPDVTGEEIVTVKEANALYASSKSNLYFKNMHYKHGSSDCFRYLSSTNIVLDGVEVSCSKAGIKFETVTNSKIINSKIFNINSTTDQGVNLSSTSTGIILATSLIYDCNGYGALIASGSIDILNTSFIKCRLSGVRSSSTLATKIKNCIFVGCGFASTYPVVKAGTGDVAVKNCNALAGLNSNVDVFNGCSDSGSNVKVYPMFAKDPFKGFVVLRLDDWTGGGTAQANFRAFTDSLAARNLPTKMSWNLNRTDIIPASDWSEIQGFVNSGHDIGMHSRGHVRVDAKNSFYITYNRVGVNYTLTIDIDFENRTGTLTIDSENNDDDVTFDLSSNGGANYRLGYHEDNQPGIISTLNNLPQFTTSTVHGELYYGKSICLKDTILQGVGGTQYLIPLNVGNFLIEEIKNNRNDIQTNLGLTNVTYAYSNGPYDAEALDSIVSFGNILSTSTVSATSSTLLRSIKMHEMSCLGYSNLQGPDSSVWRIKAQSLAAMMSSWGGFMAVLTHGTSDTKADSLAFFAQTIVNMGSRCHIGSQMEATQWILSNGYALNDRTYRCYQPDSSDFRLKSTSPCKNKGDKTAIAGIANLYTLDGVQLTDASGTVLVDSVNIGAYGTYESNAPPSIGTQPVNDTVLNGTTATFTVSVSGTEPLSYKWTLAGDSIGTTNTLNLSNVTLGMSGNYYKCVITNEFGSVTSDSALLVVEEVRIDSIRPSPWYRNRTVSIYGKWFGSSQGSDSVVIGSNNCHRAALWSNTHITDTLPDLQGTYQVNVKGATQSLRILKPRAR